MSVQSEINRILTNVNNAFNAVSDLGVEVLSTDNSDNLATRISQIGGKYLPLTGGTMTGDINGEFGDDTCILVWNPNLNTYCFYKLYITDVGKENLNLWICINEAHVDDDLKYIFTYPDLENVGDSTYLDDTEVSKIFYKGGLPKSKILNIAIGGAVSEAGTASSIAITNPSGVLVQSNLQFKPEEPGASEKFLSKSGQWLTPVGTGGSSSSSVSISPSASTGATIGTINGVTLKSGSLPLSSTTAQTVTAPQGITFNGPLISTSIIPERGNTYDLGSVSKLYKGIYTESGTIAGITFNHDSSDLDHFIIDTVSQDASIEVIADNGVSFSSKVSCPDGFFQTSDIRKKNIHEEISLEKAYDLIDKCLTILYDLKDDALHKLQVGLIAQEVEEFFPEIIATADNGEKSLDYSRLTVIILKVLKDLIKRITKLEDK